MADSTNNHPPSNFWTGFAFGSILIGVLLYSFGTKKGRQQVKNLIALAENLGEDLDEILDALKAEFKDSSSQNNLKKIAESFEHHLNPEIKKTFRLSSIINKIKTLAPAQRQKQVKKFFVKDGKLVEKKHR